MSVEPGKLTIEIYEGDPFGSACCGPGPLVTSTVAAGKLRKTLMDRSEIVERLAREYGDRVTVKRDIINQKRLDYPEYVMKLISDNKPVPYVFVGGEAVIIGKFPSYEEFLLLIRSHSE